MESSYCFQKATALLSLPREQHNEKHVERNLLIGVGSHVHYYEYAGFKWTKVKCLEVLPCRCIHGFSAGPNSHIAAFGQKAIRMFWISNQSPRLEMLTILFEFEDWILDLKWFTEQAKCAIITSHNKVLVIDSTQGHILSRHTSELNCILYSARLSSVTADDEIRRVSDLLVLSGTVFNKVAIWRCQDNPEVKSPVDQELMGHNGVIFDIHIDLVRGYILSVSDDRTIRLWGFTPRTGGPRLKAGTSVHLRTIFHGHTARVWKARLFGDLVISIGEDANIILWGLDGQIKKKVTAHKGRNIWYMTADDEYLFTGGGDSSVKAWRLDLLLKDSCQNKLGPTVVRQEKVLSLPDRPVEDFPRSLCLGNDLCVEITNSGRLNCQNLSRPDGLCRCLLMDDRLKGYTVLCGHELDRSRLLVCVGSAYGWICLAVITNSADIVGIRWLQYPHGKVMSSHTFSRIGASNPLLLVSGENGLMELYEVEIQPGNVTLLGCLGSQMLLPESKQRFITCAVILEPNYLICADKMGSLYTYHLNSPPSSDSLVLPHYALPKVHGKLGVTDMVVRDSLLYTAGRDGAYRVFSLQNGQLSLVNEHKVYKGLEWIGRLVFGAQDSLLIAGFHTTDFVLFDVSLDQLVVRIDCGGGHRSWDLSIESSGGSKQLYLAYIKTKQSQFVSEEIPQPFTVLRPGLHSAKISSCCSLTLHGAPYLVTCSDDTSVRLSKLTPGSDVSCQPVTTMTRHISNVKCCCLVRSLSQHCPYILITGGGRAQLVATRISHGANHEEAHLQYLCSIQLADRYLLTRKQLRAAENLDPDTRIMDVTLVYSISTCHLITAACSDGKIRFLTLDEGTGHFSLLDNGLTLEHCPLVLHSEAVNARSLYFVGTTDGRIYIYDITDICHSVLKHSDLNVSEPDLMLVLTHHQSGINSLMVRVDTSDSNLTVYTGGDDNSLVISVVSLNNWSVVETQRFNTFHSAQITGIVGIDQTRFVSVSIDQRILLWKRNCNGWSVESVKHTTIADIAAVSYLEESGLLVTVGEGLEVSQINSREPV